MTEIRPQLPTLDQRALLLELNHRINNELASMINVISVAVIRADNGEVKTALCNVIELIHQHADVHHALKMPEENIVVDAAEYLRRLCHSMSRSKLERLGINLVFSENPVRLESHRCWRLGMIVYELVTNAARHAFAGGHAEIRVELSRTGTFVKCRVLDNGSAAAGVSPGRGLRIVNELARSLGGEVDHLFGARGSSITLALPFIGQEQRANRIRRAGQRTGSAAKSGDLHYAQL